MLSKTPESLTVPSQLFRPFVCHLSKMLAVDSFFFIFYFHCIVTSIFPSQDSYGNLHPSEAAHHVSAHPFSSHRRE